ncbi:hypothetical protein OsJ_26273 [Oryza sativa Japonica Group]|uniref:Uncharacterized protein n=1 Tax=Oryza sativa subsp. japonica TaxID=39947 RepID=B9FZE1_ORYSJ|nr:hypothetical protein OsJ_26273 [Oryza sativa Japonica Group]
MDRPSPLGGSRHRRIELPRWSSSVPSGLGRSRSLGGGSGYGAVDESGGRVVQAELFGRPDRRVQVVGRRWTSMDFPTRMLLWPPDPVTIDPPAVEVLELVTNLGSLNPKAFVAMGCLVLVVTWAAMGVMVGMAVHQEPRKKIYGQ